MKDLEVYSLEEVNLSFPEWVFLHRRNFLFVDQVIYESLLSFLCLHFLHHEDAVWVGD